MSREELIAYLELKAHAFEGHPFHSDMSEALRQAANLIRRVEVWTRWPGVEMIKLLPIDAETADSRRPDPHPQSTGFCQYED
jgi:hypothetical protein